MIQNIIGEFFTYREEVFKCYRTKPINEKTAIFTDKRTLILLPSELAEVIVMTDISDSLRDSIRPQQERAHYTRALESNVIWTDEQDSLIISRKSLGFTVKQLAEIIGKTENNVRVRAYTLKKRTDAASRN